MSAWTRHPTYHNFTMECGEFLLGVHEPTGKWFVGVVNPGQVAVVRTGVAMDVDSAKECAEHELRRLVKDAWMQLEFGE